MSLAHAVGIDLGTTYSAVARVDETGRTSMVRNAEGELLTPSVVLFDQDETIVGKEAKKASALYPGQVAECAKRDMGSEAYSRTIGGQSFPPEVIQACILRKLRRDVAAVVGDAFKCVITVPAYFDEIRRKRTQDAGEMAGLDVLDIVNEPTAAALAFGEQLGYLSDVGAPLRELNVLVYDLGGGTFDVTLIQLKPGEITTLATDGDVQLGGYDWDERLVNHAASAFQQRFGIDPRVDESSLARLRTEVEQAKHTLTARDQANVRVECQGQSLEVAISRSLFEELTGDLLERTSYTTRQLLATTGLSWANVDCLLLVGGSSRMPMVSTMLYGLSGKQPDRSVNPDEAVARGAAIFADYLLSVRGESARTAKISVTDVNAHSLGIEGINNETLRKENVILIRRNSPLPAATRRKFVTKEDNQRSIVIQVLEGESITPTNCSAIGRAVIRQLPFGLPQGTQINVHYKYASNGRLSVRAELPGTGHQAVLELEREQGLSSAGLNRWRQVISSEGGFQRFRQAIEQQQQEKMAAAPATPAQPVPTANGNAPSSQPAMAAAPAEMAAKMKPIALQPAAQTAAPSQGSAVGTPAVPMSPIGGGARLRSDFAEQAGSASQAPADPYAGQVLAGNMSSSSVNSRSAAHSRSQKKMIFDLTKHIVSAIVGLAIGYYILCYLRPEANFLNVPLPGVPAIAPENTNPGTTALLQPVSNLES
jgi:molecular chaperone DnaK